MVTNTREYFYKAYTVTVKKKKNCNFTQVATHYAPPSPSPSLSQYIGAHYELSTTAVYLNEVGQLPQSVSLGQEQGGRPTAKLGVEPELEPRAVHLCHRGAQVWGITTAYRLNLLTQGGHRYKSTGE